MDHKPPWKKHALRASMTGPSGSPVEPDVWADLIEHIYENSESLGFCGNALPSDSIQGIIGLVIEHLPVSRVEVKMEHPFGSRYLNKSTWFDLVSTAEVYVKYKTANGCRDAQINKYYEIGKEQA